MVISSNVHSDTDSDIIVNYDSLINRGYTYFENSTIMLLKLLVKLNPSQITIAGFDGFNPDLAANYSDSSFQNDRHISEFATLNREVGKMLKESHPHIKLWVYTGYTLKELEEQDRCFVDDLKRTFDYLVDGRYDKDATHTLPYRGSDNQKVWNLKEMKEVFNG